MKIILRKAVSLVCAAGLLLSDLGSLSLAAPAQVTRELVASERDSYRVTVTYSVNEAMPDGLRLSVSEVEKPEEEPQEEPVEETPEESSEVSGEETPEETSAESAETSQEESQGESASEAPSETPAKAPLKAAAKAAQEEKEDNSPYGQYVKRSLELLKKEKKDLRFARVFNIALVDPATGATVQPDKKVKVSIQLEDAPSTQVTKVIHFGEKPEVVECTAKGESVEFTAAGFSVYVVARLGNYEYRIEDDSQRTMTLGALLEKLNVTEFGVQDVISLTSSSEAITVGSDWTITFPEKLDDPVNLTLTYNKGESESVQETIVVSSQEEDETGEPQDGDPESGENDKPTTFTVTWKNEDGTVLETDENVAEGTIPEYNGETPVKTEEGEWYYFAGWSPAPAAVTADAVFTAQFAPARKLTITAGSDSKLYDGEELTKNTYSLTGELAEGDTLTSVTVTGTQTAVGSSANVPSEAKIEDAEGKNVTGHYAITYVNGTLEVKERAITITAGSAEKTYDGQALTADTWTSTELARGDRIQSVKISGTQTKAGISDNVASEAVIVNSKGEPALEYKITYVPGTLTVNPKGVTLRAKSATQTYNSEEKTVEGYTCIVDGAAVEGLTFEGVSASGSGTATGIYDVDFTGVTLNETKDTTGNYVVTAVEKGLLFIIPSEESTTLLEKRLTNFNGDLATYEIKVNPNGTALTGDTLTLKDTFSDNQSINYASIRVRNAAGQAVPYDYSGTTGTFTIPDGQLITITYTTRVKGNAGEQVSFSNTAVLGRIEGGVFASGPRETVSETRTIAPTGTDITGTGGVYTIELFVYAQDHMEDGLPGAVFRLLDGNMQPMVYKAGPKTGQPITFTTGEKGRVTVQLSEETDGLSIRKNTVYYLEMVTAPYQIKDGEYIYYQKDNTFYSFLITDDPSYEYGGVYAYFNGDVLKVRCYREAKGVNITKRFSGNYTLTNEQKNQIRFILQKEATDTETGWEDVESHLYSEFSYGSMNFSTGRQDGTELQDNVTYRVIEENVLPAELEGIIEEKVAVSTSYQQGGTPVEEATNEFTIDPEDKLAYSYNLAFTNEYIDHKLTIIKIDENNGTALPGAVFDIFPANGGTKLASYTTDAGGGVTIRKTDPVAYDVNTLYYAVESQAPERYILPANPEKVYFYFSRNGSAVPAGLPAGATATDLTTAYNTVTIANDSDLVDVPVTVVWGRQGADPWPAGVARVTIALYRSVGGNAYTPVTGVDPISLTKQQYYDTTSFTGLPAEVDGKAIAYKVVETGIFDSGNTNISGRYASSSSISGTGWYVVSNQDAVSVTIRKEWYELDGETQITDTTGKPTVTFDLYRTTQNSEKETFTREELLELLGSAQPVRTGLTLAGGSWSRTVDSLEKTDSQGNTYNYYALEQVPDNQEDSYLVAGPTDSAPRTVTIRNKQTPVTVTIRAGDLEKTYGEPDPAFTFTDSSVMQEGASVVVQEPTGPHEDGTYAYTALVTAADGTQKTITFTASRQEGENVGEYTITPAGKDLQEGYRVLFETGTLTIGKKEVTVAAGATKVYGQADPALVQPVEGLAGEDTISYTVTREEGEDVGKYLITLDGPTDQGNYTVVFDCGTAEEPAVLEITPAEVTVTVDDKFKAYGEDDPELTATVVGLKNNDDPTVVQYDLARAEGEDVAVYAITATPAGEYQEQENGQFLQGNYLVTYVPGTFTIHSAELIVTVEDEEKTYGDPDPEWSVGIEGLQRGEDSGTLTSVLNQETGVRTYTYSVERDGETVELLRFTATRAPGGEDRGQYKITLTAQNLQQGNYTFPQVEGEQDGTIAVGNLDILPAELTVTPKHQVKAVGVPEDPLLEADIEGWRNGDDPAENESDPEEKKTIVTSSISADKTVTWTYRRGEKTLLTFTLQRAPGEEEGDYTVTVTCDPLQSNYEISYEEGVFSILSVLDIDVTQPLTDYADYGAKPSYEYTATLDLANSGLDEYEKNGFAPNADGAPTMTFTLPQGQVEMRTLKVPAGARLTLTQNNELDDYTTAIRVDGNPYTGFPPLTYVLESADTYHEIAFAHSRISLPVEARVSENQGEDGARVLAGRKGAMGIPRNEEGQPSQTGQVIDSGFADEMNSKIGYELPTDKYYAYDHASLYTAPASGNGDAVVTKITGIRYALDDGAYQWEYQAEDSDGFKPVPEGTKLVLFYLPKFVCKIGTEQFYSLKAAVEYARQNNPTATIEMLIGEYSIRSANDAVTIPAGLNITVTTATEGYEGTGTAVISRSVNLPGGHLFTNKGTLTFDNIILDGKRVRATDALVLNEGELTVSANGVLRNAAGNNGGAIYTKTGSMTVDGTLSENTATNGGAVYVESGTVTLGGALSGNSAAAGGAVYVNSGTVTVNGTLSGNQAASGGAVYLNKGTVTVNGTLAGNTAATGGAVYLTDGTLAVGEQGAIGKKGDLSGNTATGNGGGVYQMGGTVTNDGTVSGNTAANGGGFYRVNGSLTIGGAVSENTAATNGGGFYSAAGTVTVTGALTGNHAANGGAGYVSGTILNLNGATFSGENRATNGGALYALNATTVVGGTWSSNKANDGTAASFTGNTAADNGGAVYLEGGSLHVRSGSALQTNTAANGGGIYATGGSITLTNGSLSSNTAAASGGGIYAGSASVKMENGSLSGNTAQKGNGGAVYSESGTVTVSGGSLSGNVASMGDILDPTLGLGGAIYAGSGTVNFTGGSITGGNSAVNGAGIYVGSGIANISASITGNTASAGGAVGVGSTNARLNFKGNAEVNNNTMGTLEQQSNVYLDVDSELVINADSLGNSKKIGVYVPGEVDSDQVVKHGDVTGYFGAYSSAGTVANVASVFKSDRWADLKVGYENNRMYWVHALQYDVYYLKNYDNQFPPTANYTQSPSKKVCSNKEYNPRTRESNIYDLVTAMKLYEAHNNDFASNVGDNYASTAVYAYTYSDKAMGNTFGNYLSEVRWDGENRRWKLIKQDGTEAPADTSRLVIFYSAPAYLTIVNNNESELALEISELKVLGKDAANGGLYGFVTARNGATAQTLNTVTAGDLKLQAGDSVKLMFPGAQGQAFTLKGAFTGDGAGESTSVPFTFNGGEEQTITGTAVDLQYNLNASDAAAEIVFGQALPICKIGEVPFSTLKAAMAYAVTRKAATGNGAYTIEMLVDYLVPANDVLNIPTGYDITFTTADKDAETLPYTGSGTRATLSRDTGNAGASVIATGSTLTVDNLAFDGRSLTSSAKGGAVSATNCTTVKIQNCYFKGYRAGNGGAVYVDNKAAESSLTVDHCDFYDCQTNASVDKAGGGGVWTTARELYVRNCSFDSCACLKGLAQAGSIFHNIRAATFADSKTEVSGCTFSNSFAVGGSGGTIESDAMDITVQQCTFTGSYTNKSGGNGGAINVYASGDFANIGTYCILRVTDCTFDNCNAKNKGVGGVIRTTSHDLILRGCLFREAQAVTGGAVAMTNSNAKRLEIYGCRFENCLATGKDDRCGGAVSAPVPTVIVGVEDTEAEDYLPNYLDGTAKDGKNHFIDCTANRGGGIDNPTNDATVTLKNVEFLRCAARTSNGGALYTQAKTLSITGESNAFTDCSGYGSGGAVFQNRSAAGSSVTLENCVFTGCEANNNGNGGGLYASAVDLTISRENNAFTDCTAAGSGGGLYHATSGTATLINCGFENCTAKAGHGGGLYTTAHELTISGEKSVFSGCTAQQDGGGLYQNRNANGSTFSMTGGGFDNCTAVGNNGGALYTPAKSVTLQDCFVTNSTAKAQGGGVYVNPSTARFEGCTIRGNSATNSDSKGGGVYVGGGTTEYKSGTVSACTAGNGGGWYQNNSTLYILGGSISGSATNGGGLYMYDGNTRVYQYGGTVAGTATANGGGIYQNNGSVYLNEGGSIGSAVTDGENHVYTATATNGGGVYVRAGAVHMNGGVITNCSATGNGGGVYFTSTGYNNDFYFYGDDTSKIQHCKATNGGGFYLNSNTLHMGENGKTSQGIIEDCQATGNGGGVYVAGGILNLRNASSVDSCSAGGNGGGVYMAGGSFNLNGGDDSTSSNDESVAENTAANGGGVYMAGGTFTFKRGKIVRNEADENGGGVYVAGGTFSMTTDNNATVCGIIGGAEGDGNTAKVGAGIFVADGQAASFNDWASKTLEISYNHATQAGGGIAVGGHNAELTFTNAVKVQNNTMGEGRIRCNVYLDQDSNTVINNNQLNAASYIGVYVSDAQNPEHGLSGRPFATYTNSNSGNLDVYHNDRLPYLYGVQGSSNHQVIWATFVCKITDGNGTLLYKDTAGSPAVYPEVENRVNSNNNNSQGAFTVLNTTATPALYRRNEDGTFTLYNDDGQGAYQVQMLVPEYETGNTRQIKLDQNISRTVTLTTASATEDECGFKYTGDARFAAAIKRTAATGCMIYIGQRWTLALTDITLDGGAYKATEEGAILRVVDSGAAILNKGATLQNGATNNKAGGAVYLKDDGASLTMNAGSVIKDCSAGTSNGGGVALNNGTFTMNGGTISGCSAANGGGVHLNNSSRMFMNGGAITGNNATAAGGGIQLGNGNARLTFAGLCSVTDNTLNGSTPCNVQLSVGSTDVIRANGLDGKSEIGVYVPNTNNLYNKHGIEGMPFGTREQETENCYCFVNDRSTNLRGYMSTANHLIYWEYHPLLRVTKEVESDWPEDLTKEFTIKVHLKGLTTSLRNQITGMTFRQVGEDGTATITLRAGDSATAVLPKELDKHEYTVEEVLNEAEQEDYTTTVEQNGEESVSALVATGQLGENVGKEDSTSLSEVVFHNTREKGNLTVSKTVVSSEEKDHEESFTFKLTLDPDAETKITKTYATKTTDSDGTETAGTLDVTAGVAVFTLKHHQSITVLGLPTDLPYTAEETLTESQQRHIRTSVSKDGGEDSYITSQNGEIRKAGTVIDFTNSFLAIVCKITNRSRALLYYREASGSLQPAIFSHLEEAFDMLNSGGLRTSTGGTASGNMRIEMVVPEYTMERQATLNSGKTVTLSTALWSDEDYPYNDGVDNGVGTAVVFRGFNEESMFADGGALTLDNITLDGAAQAEETLSATANGGIVSVTGPVRLVVNNGATLLNSTTTGYGGAIYLPAGASLLQNGTIRNCSAANGGGVYAENGFTTMTFTGTIAGCEATTGDGGAIYAGTGTSVNLKAGTLLTGNRAKQNGGAVRSGAAVVLHGAVGGDGQGNTADNEGGGICMTDNAMFTMYAGSMIASNTAKNGGGLSTDAAARIAGGAITGNQAQAADGQGGLGGGLYATENATVTVSGTAVLSGNSATQGGAVYDRGSVSMNGGSLNGNTATGKGGAVYVADTGTEDGAAGHSFSMTGGSVRENRSPEGAISTDSNAVLTFSGNCVVTGNTDPEGERPMNVYLGHDSNGIIQTTGLGASAQVGVYVADGEPEPEGTEHRSDRPIYADHGVGGRNFGTYTGSNIAGARLNKFTNDRNDALTGMSGAAIGTGGQYYVAWIGQGLSLRVTQYLLQRDENGDPVRDEQGKPVLSEEVVPVAGATFTLTNITDATEETPGVQVWTGKSGADGLVSIPWEGNETSNGKGASFKPYTTYQLEQTEADGKATVRPAGHWTVTVARDNAVTWQVTDPQENVDRIFQIVPAGTSMLGETFGLYNDVKPTITFNANGGKLSDGKLQRQDDVPFSSTEVAHRYRIDETDPTWGSYVFRQWATMPNRPDVTVETEDRTEEEIAAAETEALKALGYYEYTKGSTVTFFRGTDGVRYSENEAKESLSAGNMTLYAQWEPVVCKITTSYGGDVVYESNTGYPAAYGTLEEGFAALNSSGVTFKTKDGATVHKSGILYLEMLVENYTMTTGVQNLRLGTTVLTTAPSGDAADGYPYGGTAGSVCTIYRGACDDSMITNERSLTLTNITLDGRSPSTNERGEVEYLTKTPVCDGGILHNRKSSVLTISSSATLQNSSVDGNGGAVSLAGTSSMTVSGTLQNNSATADGGAAYVGNNTTATIHGGRFTGNSAENGAGIYLDEKARLNLSGNPNFGGTGVENDELVTQYQNGQAAGNFTSDVFGADANEKNGGKDYQKVRQDIYIAGTLDDPAASLAVIGAITSGDGTIWVGAEDVNHYEMLKQFAVFSGSGTSLSNAQKESTMKAFRNAMPDSQTNCGGDYLTGQKGETANWIYWTGGFDVVFLKTDSFGVGLAGAIFTLYTDEACTKTFRMTFQNDKRETTVSSDGTAAYKDKNGETVTLKRGEVLLPKLPPRTFYLKETAPATGYAANEAVYRLVISDQGVLTMDRKLSGEAAFTEVYKEQRGSTEQYAVMNLPLSEREVILRKVSGTFAALAGARFRIFRVDGTPVTGTDINGATTATFTSGASGVYFVDVLPYGTYYLYEEDAPAGYTDKKWFILTVSEGGTTVGEIADTARITRLNGFVRP